MLGGSVLFSHIFSFWCFQMHHKMMVNVHLRSSRRASIRLEMRAFVDCAPCMFVWTVFQRPAVSQTFLT
ncbi:hypothetical protein JHK82_035963 [Glycine max]|uniref:Uncharacterized protein n=2 Tax=Glycine subgen. Soja TaxID=1462606 RepID=K7LZ42_SOYBN|nr:hypothetical protein JHK87_035889 [Glycine soja]KAG4970275.1 hypothetical protein JHK85_036696 [Glycine max]KAG4976677.1 hypothetical protein JHK86_036151 [Glycine max]KAG5112694.1 hypothetical protein JHK82_035963 [Glycine max]KAG5129973.1 hypothetical protein JHK84_036370 [Glycine max]